MNEAATITDITTATGEILVMLAGAFILGWIARWVYELVVYAPLWLEGHTDDFITEQDGTTIRHHEDIVVRGESQEQ